MTANIVFDLDGTLIDSAPDIMGVANRLLAARGLTPIDLPTCRTFIGNGAPVFIERLRKARDIPEAEQAPMLQAFLSHYDSAVDQTAPYPAVKATLANLVNGNRLGLCTNKPHRPCLAVLRHLKLDHFFEVVLGGDSLPVRKPDPLPLLTVFDRLGPGPRVFVGDSEVDAETAQKAGVPFLLFTQGYRKTPVDSIPHDASFDHFDAFPDALTRVLAA